MLLIHGSATDHLTWLIQLSSALRRRFQLWAYDRRGTGQSGGDLPELPERIEEHAADALALARQAAAPVWMVGSSFGAVVALEALRTAPELFRGVGLIEPPLPVTAEARATSDSFLAEFDRTVAASGGPAGAELFLRTVLGAEAFGRIPGAFLQRSTALWRQIRADAVALRAYAPRYAELARVAVPTLLLAGERSSSYFRPALDELARALPRARLVTLAGAGHMLHAEAPRRFAELLAEFAEGVEAAED